MKRKVTLCSILISISLFVLATQYSITISDNTFDIRTPSGFHYYRVTQLNHSVSSWRANDIATITQGTVSVSYRYHSSGRFSHMRTRSAGGGRNDDEGDGENPGSNCPDAGNCIDDNQEP